MDTQGSGRLPASNATYRSAAKLMQRSERTVHNLLERLVCAQLVKRSKGTLVLASYSDLTIYASASTIGKKKFHHIKPAKIPANTPFEYVLRTLEEKESQDRQRYAKRQKMKAYHQCLTLPFSAEQQIEQEDFQALVHSFKTGQPVAESCDPDTARSHSTKSQQMCQQSHTGSWYWQQRLEKLGLVTVERDRQIISPKRKDLSRYSRLGAVFYSRKTQSTVLQLPNRITPNI